MFASAALARRVDAAEARLTLAVGRAGSGLVRELGTAAMVFSGGSPGDKVVGLGFEPFDAEALARHEAEVRALGGEVRVELSSLADPEVARALSARGYVLLGFENVCGRRLSDLAAPPADVEVGRVSSPEEVAAWLDALATGFTHPDTGDGAPPPTESFGRADIEHALDVTLGVPGFVRYLARREGVVAGGASMRIEDGVALLTGAATLPAQRRRGVQTALLATRLLEAAAAGCDLAVITTGPGTKSAENAARNGFSLLYVRAVLLKA